MNTFGYRILGTAILVSGLSLSLAAHGAPGPQAAPAAPAPAPAKGVMSVKQQNALVQHFCVGCHDDLQLTGGLSLEHFDAAHLNPIIATLMEGKLQAGQMPPKNMPRPNPQTLSLFVKSLMADTGHAPAGQMTKAGWPSPKMPRLAKGIGPTVVDFAHKGNYMSVATQNKLVHTICTQCHIDAIKPGGVSFQHFNLATAPQHAQLVEKMIAKLQAGMMPPQTAPKRPDQASINALALSLANRIDRVAALHPNPGFRTFQRLDRAEYADSIRSLLGLNIDVGQWLPPDTMSHNFADIANVQTFSPTLMQGFLDAADQISRLAVGDPGATPQQVSFAADPTASQMHHVAGAPYGTRGGLSVVNIFPADGTYTFKMLFFGVPTGQLYGSTIKNDKIEISIDGRRVGIYTINPHLSQSDPQGLTITTQPIAVASGPHRVSAAFIKRWDGPIDDLLEPHRYTLADTNIGMGPGVTTLPHLRTLSITGPFHVTGISNDISRQKIFICRPIATAQEVPCAQKILTHLADAAYRRPITQHELASLMHFYQLGRKQGDFEDGIRLGLQAILASPRFLFRLEPQPVSVRPGHNYRITDMALASRLSYFIWGQPPDAELIKLAREGRLHEPVVLDAQVRRMLKDPRSFSLATEFAYHWLRLEDVKKVRPDALSYPQYNANLEHDMIKETELFFDSIVKGNKNVMDLLTADYTYANQDLANYYGISGVAGPQFRKVSLLGTHRRGILGEGSVQVETSVATRTDPVLRGKWVLEVLIGQPPPPPPPGVNTNLSTSSPSVQNGKPLSVRERMALHRANPVCASCHGVIDPIGLALENFGPGGHYRIRDNGVRVDAATTLWDGSKINGLPGLVNAMLKHKATFLTVFTRNLMAYALGRRIHYYDMPAVRSILHQAARNGNRLSSFVLGVVNSDAFRMSRAGTLSASNGRPSTQSKKGF